jgi:hypothetical protein
VLSTVSYEGKVSTSSEDNVLNVETDVSSAAALNGPSENYNVYYRFDDLLSDKYNELEDNKKIIINSNISATF